MISSRIGVNYVNADPAPSTTDRGTRTLGQHEGKYVVSREVVDSLFAKDQRLFQSMSFEYSYGTKPPAPDEQYELSFYGISSPGGPVYEDRRTNWPLWGGVGVSLIIGSLALALVARRRRRKRS